MKKMVYLNLLLLLLLLGSCNNRNYVDAEKNGYFELVDNIHILYDIDQVEGKEEASIYKVEYFQADTMKLLEELLQYPVKEEEGYAMGRAYFTDTPDGMMELLIVYDGGEEFGVDDQVNGGFRYNFSTVEKSYWRIISMFPGHSDDTVQIYGDRLRDDFSKWKDLDFLSVNDAINILKEMAKDCDLPDMEIDMVYALDRETMQKHSEIVNQIENKDLVTWTKEDEAYLLYFVQVVDGIPLINHLWEGVGRKSEEVPIYALLANNGEFQFEMQGTVKVIEEIEKHPIIAPEEAEASLLEELHQSLQISNIDEETLTLSYVLYHDKDEMKLIPVWFFCIAREIVKENTYTQEQVTVKKYEHFAVNAITGKQIKTER